MELMSKNYVFPDADDRSANAPSLLLEKKKVLGLYNQEHPEDEDMERVTQKVRNWVQEKAKKEGWSETENVGGGQILLKRTDLKSVHEE